MFTGPFTVAIYTVRLQQAFLNSFATDGGRDRGDAPAGDRRNSEKPDPILQKDQLDANRLDGPELPPSLTLVVRGNSITLADEPVSKLVSNGEPDDVDGAMIRCDNPVTLRGAR